VEDLLGWQHLQELPRSARHVRRLCTWLISLQLTTRSTLKVTNPTPPPKKKKKKKGLSNRGTHRHTSLTMSFMFCGVLWLLFNDHICTHFFVLSFLYLIMDLFFWVLFKDYGHDS
jgi:hypothetical protein